MHRPDRIVPGIDDRTTAVVSARLARSATDAEIAAFSGAAMRFLSRTVSPAPPGIAPEMRVVTFCFSSRHTAAEREAVARWLRAHPLASRVRVELKPGAPAGA